MFKTVSNKIKFARETLLVTVGMTISSVCFAQNDPNASVQKTTSLLQNIKALLPVAAQIGGVIIMIGGLWSMYQHYKSGGRDGSIATGIAGVLIGAAMFFLSGMLKMGGGALGVDQSTALPS